MTAGEMMPDPAVEAFNIKIKEREVRAEWHHAEGGKSSEPGKLDIDPIKERTIGVLVDFVRNNKLYGIDELTVLGDLLFTTLFGPPGDNGYGEAEGPGRLLYDAMRAASDGKRLLRVSLEIDPDAANGSLVSWPWEYLHTGRSPGPPHR